MASKELANILEPSTFRLFTFFYSIYIYIYRMGGSKMTASSSQKFKNTRDNSLWLKCGMWYFGLSHPFL